MKAAHELGPDQFRARYGVTLDEVKRLMAAKADDVVKRHMPDAAYAYGKWSGRNPRRRDRNPGSFYVYGSGHPKAGGYVDYAGDATAGKATGGPLDLVAYLSREPMSYATSLACSLAWLGLDTHTGDPEALKRQAAEAEAAAARTQAAAADKLIKARGRVASLFFRDGQALAGTPAERYLREARRVPLDLFPELPQAVRYLPQQPNWREPRGALGYPRFDTLAAAMSLWDVPVASLQRTSLTPEGAKAAVRHAKLIYPSSRGAVIRLWKGKGRLSPEKARAQGRSGETLVICEGAEDGLSLIPALPEARVWACCGVSNLRHVEIGPTIGTVIVAADNDWQQSAARAELDLGLMALKAQCADVRVAFAAEGKDFNDWLRS